jgi:anthranilate phosphoribosyltransferase
MIKEALQKTINREDLTREEAFAAMNAIMEGEATASQIGAFLVALRMKGEKPQEIAGFAESMRGKAAKVIALKAEEAVDLVGTGGDGKNTFNISTAASFVVAGAGVPVAKHGNRSVSSKCGSADVLTELGVNLELNNEQVSDCLNEVGIAFLFAPKLHPAMKYASGPRREIGVRSVFNILGPITNPAGVKRQLLGVYHRELARLLAEVLQQLDSKHIMLVHSQDGLDEISLAEKTHVVEVKDGDIREYEITPEDFGLERSDEAIAGGDAQFNAVLLQNILTGEKGAARDIVIMNAAAGLVVAGKAPGFQEGARLAAESIDSGAASFRLEALREFTGRFK